MCIKEKQLNKGYYIAMRRYKISLSLLKNTSLIYAVLTCEIFFNINGEISNLQRACTGNFFLLHKIL